MWVWELTMLWLGVISSYGFQHIYAFWFVGQLQRWLFERLEEIGVVHSRWWELVRLDENSLLAGLRQVGQFCFRRLRAGNQERKAFDWVGLIETYFLTQSLRTCFIFSFVNFPEDSPLRHLVAGGWTWMILYLWFPACLPGSFSISTLPHPSQEVSESCRNIMSYYNVLL